MDLEQKARRQSRRVIISEILTVVAVIITVSILALIVSGYWLNSDFEVERQGMVQVYSVPTGADLSIDGSSSWLQRTNTSKVLSTGQHTISLSKEGYDSWTKTITIREGLLYRLHYPRLFPTERTKSTVYDASAANFASVSPNHDYLLIANNTTSWQLINLDNDKLEPRKIDISKLFSFINPTNDASTSLFTGQIKSADWDRNSEHILIKAASSDGSSSEWAVLDIRNPNNSVNITRDYAATFSDVKIFDNSSNTLLVIRDGNLHKIDLNNRQLSAILVEKVHSFDHFETEIVFSAGRTKSSLAISETSQDDAPTSPYYIGMLKINDTKVTELAPQDAPAKVTISKFYEDKYISTLIDQTLTLYRQDNFEKTFQQEIGFIPQDILVGHDGEFIVLSNEAQIATLDMEAQEIHEWTTASTKHAWLDNNMIYSVADGILNVYDFDGYNHRTLSSNVSSHFPATITADKWLYYFSDGQITREELKY